MSERLQALEALYQAAKNTYAMPYRSEKGRITGYVLSARACKKIRDAVSTVSKAERSETAQPSTRYSRR